MGSGGTRAGGMLVCALAVALALGAPTPAWALSCGSKSQPVCIEAPPPGVVVRPPAGGNPYGLQPLSRPLSGDTQLWASVRGHKPYGFNATSALRDGTTYDDEAHLHRQVGASITGLSVSWAYVQQYPNAAEGKPWNYSALDEEYLSYIKQGIRPVLSFMRTPRRFTRHHTTVSGSSAPGCGTSDSCWNPPRSGASGRLSTFVRDLVKRYPLAAGIELWNEPNIANPFWGTDPPNPEYYASLLNLTHDAVKGVNPHMPVLGGSLATTGRDGTLNGYDLMSLPTFLRRMLKAGARHNMDAFSHHPYLGPYPADQPDEATEDTILRKRIVEDHQFVLDAYSAAGVPMDERIVWGELGASTTDGWTAQEQSDWLGFQWWLADTSHSFLPLSDRTDGALFHEAVENPTPTSGLAREKGYGFVKRKTSLGFATKPVYCTFRTWFGEFPDCPTYVPAAR